MKLKRKKKRISKKSLYDEITRIKEHIYLNFNNDKYHIYVKKYDRSYLGDYEYQILEVITEEQVNSVAWQKVAYKDLPVDTPYLLVIKLDRELHYNMEYYILLNGEIKVKNGEVKFNFHKEDKKEKQEEEITKEYVEEMIDKFEKKLNFPKAPNHPKHNDFPKNRK